MIPDAESLSGENVKELFPYTLNDFWRLFVP
jgi:hypothetical protein